MSSALLVLLGAAIVYAGVLLGAARERGRKPSPPLAPDLFCGCGHELSFHNGLEACKHEDRAWVHNKAGVPFRDDKGDYARQITPCGCRQYTGDLPHDWYARTGLPQ